MTDDLPTLIAVSRARPRERRLCCPQCGGEVVLVDGALMCHTKARTWSCGRAGERLAELTLARPAG